MSDSAQEIQAAKKSSKINIILSFIVLLGAVLRVYKLGAHNIWLDEFISVLYLRNWDFKYTFYFLHVFSDYPLYLCALKAWSMFFGESEFAIRSLSAVFGVFSIVTLFKISSLLFDKKTAAISSFILAVSPIHIWYSQEARKYSMSVFFVMLVVYFFIMALKSGKVLRYWVSFVISSIVSIYANYSSILFVFLCGLVFLFNDGYRRVLLYYLLSVVFILLPFSLLLPYVCGIGVAMETIFWIPRPDLVSLFITFDNFNVGYNATQYIYYASSFVFYSLFLWGVISNWRSKVAEVKFLLVLIFAPILGAFLVSLKIPVYLDRYLLLSSPFYYILIAAGFSKLSSVFLKAALFIAAGAMISASLYNYYNYLMPVGDFHHFGVHVKKPVDDILKKIKGREKETEIVAISNFSDWSLAYYFKDFTALSNGYLFFLESDFKKYEPYFYQLTKGMREMAIIAGIKPFNAVNLEDKVSHIPGVKNIKEYDFKRICLVSSSWDRSGNIDLNSRLVREWMLKNYRLIDSEFTDDGVVFDLFYQK